MLEHLHLSPVEKIVLSRTYDVTSRWSLQAYCDLCMRQTPLTINEAHALGLDTAIRVSQLRERLRSGGGGVVRRHTISQLPHSSPGRPASARRSPEDAKGPQHLPDRGQTCTETGRFGNSCRPSSFAIRLIAQTFGFDTHAEV